MKRNIIFLICIALISCEKYESGAPTQKEIKVKPLNQYSDLPIVVEITDVNYNNNMVYCDINSDGTWEYNNYNTNTGTSDAPFVFIATSNTQNITILQVNSMGLSMTKKYNFAINTANDSKFSYFTDSRDNQKYRTVTIGAQIWMAKNLNFNATGSKVYDNNLIKANVFGRLYNWQTATSVCPVGWHLPSDLEWQQLERSIGMSETDVNSEDYVSRRGVNVGDKLKVGGTSGLNLLYAGAFSTTTWLSWDLNVYVDINEDGYYWTSTGQLGSWAYIRNISSQEEWNGIGRNGLSTNDYASVRCIKN